MGPTIQVPAMYVLDCILKDERKARGATGEHGSEGSTATASISAFAKAIGSYLPLLLQAVFPEVTPAGAGAEQVAPLLTFPLELEPNVM